MKAQNLEEWRYVPVFDTNIRLIMIAFSLPLFILTIFFLPSLFNLFQGVPSTSQTPPLLYIWTLSLNVLISGSLFFLLIFSIFQPLNVYKKISEKLTAYRQKEIMFPKNKDNKNIFLESYLIECDEPNAFILSAFRKKPKVVLTSGLIDCLSSLEISGVIEHEIGHLKNKDTFFIMWASTSLNYLKYWFGFSLILEFISLSISLLFFPALISYVLYSTFLFSLSYILFYVTVISTSRIREKLADAHAVKTPKVSALISASRKVSSLLSSNTYDSRSVTRNYPYLMFHNSLRRRFWPQWMIKYFFADHPPTSERIDDIQQGRFLITKGKIYPLSLENSIFLGFISLFFAISTLRISEYLPPVEFGTLSLQTIISGFSLFMPVLASVLVYFIMLCFSQLSSIRWNQMLRFVVSFFFHTVIISLIFLAGLIFINVANNILVGDSVVLVNITRIYLPLFVLHIQLLLSILIVLLPVMKYFVGYLQKKFPERDFFKSY